ncbi:hypothetical protein [Burkholderia ubonensis]|uniref:hypothetical protein n=1 Tax=Burkholderia ubonensis TaxID=101571 RepID=UPI000F55E270|nr:hypothetical protein [Burkholderia ubonensis]
MVYPPFRHTTIRKIGFAFGIAICSVQLMAVFPFGDAVRAPKKRADIRLSKNERATRIRRFVPADISRPRTVFGDLD